MAAEYAYPDENGALLFAVERREPKSFVQKVPDGKGGWRYSLNGVRRVPYRLPELLDAIARSKTIFVVEGEKDADALASLGLCSTTSAQGASWKWPPEWSCFFEGATLVVVIPDCDLAGRTAARQRTAVIASSGADVCILDLAPARSDGYDASDWLAEGHSVAELEELACAARRVGQSPMAGDHDAPGGFSERRIVTRSLAEIEPREMRWLWEQRIIHGDFGIVAGLPGIGKSYLCAAVAAALSRGRALPGQSARQACDVILLALEDSPESVLRPRFERLEADLGRVHLIDGISAGQTIAPFSLQHVDLTARLLERIPETALIIIDPIASELGGVDTWRSTEVRAVLDPFLALTRARGVSVVAVGHTTKRSDGHALLKIEGSLGGFVGRARYVLGVGQDDSGQRGVGVLKSNYGATEGVPVVQYAINESGTFSWGEETTAIHAGDLFAPPATSQELSASEEARDAIIEALRGGEITAEDLGKKVRAAGILPGTLNRVRPSMRAGGVIERLGGGAAGPVRWRLKATDSHDAPQIRTLSSAKECVELRKSEPDLALWSVANGAPASVTVGAV